jgi:AraC family transcriptional regulator
LPSEQPIPLARAPAWDRLQSLVPYNEDAQVTTALSIIRGSFGRVALLDMDTSLVKHAHHHCHLIMKASGPDQDFTVEGQAFPVRDDTAVAVNTWQEHEYVHCPGPERTLFLALYIEPAWLAEADPSFSSCAQPGFFPQSFVPLSPEITRMRRKLAERLATELSGSLHDIEQTILDLSLAVAHEFSEWRERSNRNEQRAPKDFRIRRAVRAIQAHAGERINLDRIASTAGLSRAHFNYLFRRCIGVSPAVYANATRIEAAVEALRSPECGIGTISDELGFSAQSNFTRFFQQHTGTPPHQFRRAMAHVS